MIKAAIKFEKGHRKRSPIYRIISWAVSIWAVRHKTLLFFFQPYPQASWLTTQRPLSSDFSDRPLHRLAPVRACASAVPYGCLWEINPRFKVFGRDPSKPVGRTDSLAILRLWKKHSSQRSISKQEFRGIDLQLSIPAFLADLNLSIQPFELRPPRLLSAATDMPATTVQFDGYSRLTSCAVSVIWRVVLTFTPKRSL